MEAAGERALAGVLDGAGQEADLIHGDFERDVARERHLARVAHQSEAGDVGAAVDVVSEHGFTGGAIQFQHGLNGGGHVRLGRDAAFDGGGDNAGADLLGEDERVAGTRAGIRFDASGVDGAGDGVAEFNFVVGDAVAAEDGAFGLAHFFGAALEDLLERGQIAFSGIGQDGERRDGAAAHGVDIAQGVGGGDGAEGIRVIDDGSEEVDGLHQGQVRRDLIDAGVIGGIEADQHVGVGPAGHFGQYLVKNLGTELGGAAPGFDAGGEFVELGGLFHGLTAVERRRPVITIIAGMRRTSVFSAFLLLGLALTLVSREPQTDPRLKKASRAAEHAGWIQVHLEGTPGEVGFQHGYLLWAEIQDNFRTISTEMAHDEKKDWEFFRKTAQEILWPHVEQEYRDEMLGIVEGQKARGGKLDIWDVVAMNAWLELPYYDKILEKSKPGITISGNAADHCSAFVATGKYTRDGRIVIGHNN